VLSSIYWWPGNFWPMLGGGDHVRLWEGAIVAVLTCHSQLGKQRLWTRWRGEKRGNP
jgi:hypothetical protein